MYVDDVISGAENPEDAYKLYETSRSRLMQGGFKLRKFTTNSTTTCPDTIPDDVSYAKSMFESERSDSNQEQRILDVLWNTNTDKILLDFKHINYSASPTIRASEMEHGPSGSKDL